MSLLYPSSDDPSEPWLKVLCIENFYFNFFIETNRFLNSDSDTKDRFQKSFLIFFLWRVKVVIFDTLVAKLYSVL